MKIDRRLILALRKQRSWSQEELAGAAGLNLRTVQRIERSGTASLHSKKALAAAFDIEVSTLDYLEETMPTKFEYRVIRFDLKRNASTDFSEFETQMNVLGAEGWDLVRISEILGVGTITVALVSTFKRAEGSVDDKVSA